MTVTMPTVAETRGELVQAYREALTALLTDATRQVPSGEWEGVPVVTAKDANEALDAVFGQPLPMPSETSAEVHTPAEIFVSAICPKCSLPAVIKLEVGSQLVVENTISGELKLKAKAKSRTHVCGQLPLPDKAEELEGQSSFDLADIVGAPNELPEADDDADGEP